MSSSLIRLDPWQVASMIRTSKSGNEALLGELEAFRIDVLLIQASTR